MTKFGSQWEDHVQKIESGWKKHVKQNDIVMIVGDISWAGSIEEARPDFEFIEKLPGKKVLSIGNHDFWFSTSTKSNAFFFDNYSTIVPLTRNDYIMITDDVVITAVRGYMNENHPEFKEEYRAAFAREVKRLEDTLRLVPSTVSNIIVGSHYPILDNNFRPGPNSFLRVMTKYNVTHCVYGHLHGDAQKGAVSGKHNGIEFQFVAGDSCEFIPKKVMEV